MTQSEKPSNRRNLLAITAASAVGGVASIFVGRAEGQDMGAAATQIMLLIQEFQKYQKTFDGYISKFDQLKNGFKDYVDSYFDGIRLIEELKGSTDKFFFGNTKTLGFKLASIRPEFEKFTKDRIAEVERLGKLHESTPVGQRHNRSILAAKARSSAGHTLGEVGARETRAKYVAFGEHLEKNPPKGKSKAEAYTSAAGPFHTEQRQLILESSLRQEQLLARILDILGEPQRAEVKPYGKTEFARDFDAFKAGKGTLPGEGDE